MCPCIAKKSISPSKQRPPEMWFMLYLHIHVQWVGTVTPQHSLHPAQHILRFNESFETVEDFRYRIHSDVELIFRQTENIYCGPNRITTIRSVSLDEYSQIEARLVKECVELDRIERMFA